MVPSSTTSSGMMLYWSPPWILPMVRTRERAALISRVVMAWRDRTMWGGRIDGVYPFFRGGAMAAAPPNPDGELVKGRHAAAGGGNHGAAGDVGPQQGADMEAEDGVHSIQRSLLQYDFGSLTLLLGRLEEEADGAPELLPVFLQDLGRAPMSMVAWASCPQACITPGRREEKGSPVSSWMGRASMSARRAPFDQAGRPGWRQSGRCPGESGRGDTQAVQMGGETGGGLG